MKKNKKYLLFGVIFISLLVICFIAFVALIGFGKSSKADVPSGYIAVFHGRVGSEIRETYIYKQDNGHDNYGFDYINVTNKKENAEQKSIITDRGSVDWTDNVFGIAEDNNAYSYVTLPDSNKKYTISQFRDRFLMN